MPSEKLTVEGLMYDWFTDEASRLAQRTDWFLIAHAILLEAFFSVNNHHLSAIVVGCIGVLTAYLWLMVGYRQRWLLTYWGACMEREQLMGPDASGLFTRLFEIRRAAIPKRFAWAKPTPTFAIVLPVAFVVAWFTLVSVETKPWWVGTSAAVVTVIVGTLVTALANKGPRIAPEHVDRLISPTAPDGSRAG